MLISKFIGKVRLSYLHSNVNVAFHYFINMFVSSFNTNWPLINNVKYSKKKSGRRKVKQWIITKLNPLKQLVLLGYEKWKKDRILKMVLDKGILENYIIKK